MPGLMHTIDSYKKTVETMRNVLLAALAVAVIVVAVVIYKKTHKS